MTRRINRCTLDTVIYNLQYIHPKRQMAYLSTTKSPNYRHIDWIELGVVETDNDKKKMVKGRDLLKITNMYYVLYLSRETTKQRFLKVLFIQNKKCCHVINLMSFKI